MEKFQWKPLVVSSIRSQVVCFDRIEALYTRSFAMLLQSDELRLDDVIVADGIKWCSERVSDNGEWPDFELEK